MKSSLPSKQRWVPVVSSTGLPLMPCRPVRARKLVQRGRAVKRWKNRLFYIQHPKHGKCLVGGSNGTNQVSLHTTMCYTRIARNARPEDLQVISYSPWILIGNTDPLSVKLEHRQARRNQALVRSSLRGRNFLPAMNGGVPSSLYGEK